MKVGSNIPADRRAEIQRQYRAEQRSVDREIGRLHEQLELKRKDSATRLDKLKADYEAQMEADNLRYQTQVEKEKLKTDEAIAKTRTRQNEELKRVKVDSESDLQKTKEFYNDSIQKAEFDGKKELRETQFETQIELERKKRQAQAEAASIEALHKANMTQLSEHQQEVLQKNKGQSQKELEQMQQYSHLAKTRAQKHFETGFKDLLGSHQRSIEALQNRMQEKISDLKSQAQRSLASISDRDSDPFYQLIRFDPMVSEGPDEFVVTAHVPKYEQANISVNIQGKNLILTGTREVQQNEEADPGSKVSTYGYQTYRQTVPLDWPVRSQGLMKEFEGETLIVTVPKDFVGSPPDEKEINRIAQVPTLKDDLNLPDLESEMTLVDEDGKPIPPESDDSLSTNDRLGLA